MTTGRLLPLFQPQPGSDAPLEPCPPGGCQGLPVPRRSTKPLLMSLGVVTILIVAQVVGYFVTRSLAVAFEALHVVVDAGAIALALFAAWIARRPATSARTFGYYRVEILAALVNGAALVAITVHLMREAWERITTPEDAPVLAPKYMIVFGAIGLVGSLINTWLIYRGHASHGHGHGDHGHGDHAHHHADLNLQGVLLHQISDALGSLAAIVAGVVILATGFVKADAVIAAGMAVLILAREVMLCLRAVDVLLESTPRHVDVAAFEASLKRVDFVKDVHDLHIWTLTSGVYAMSCHATIARGADHRRVLGALVRVIRERFGIEHTTIQLEEEGEAQLPASAPTVA